MTPVKRGKIDNADFPSPLRRGARGEVLYNWNSFDCSETANIKWVLSLHGFLPHGRDGNDTRPLSLRSPVGESAHWRDLCG